MGIRPTFYGLEIGKTALFTSQLQLDVTSHNIANAETEGYTRQRINTAAIAPNGIISRFAPLNRAIVGGGVESLSVGQIRSAFVDKQIRLENSSLGYWDARTDGISYIESLFDELSDTSISKILADFSDAVQELSKRPEDQEIRKNMQMAGINLTDAFNHYYKQFSDMHADENEVVKTMTGQINDLAKNLSALNKNIYMFEITGAHANDLRDQRNLLLDELSKLVNIEYHEDSDGIMTVSVGGDDLVYHDQWNELEAVADATNPLTGATNDLYTVRWKGSGNAFNFTNGELQAHIDLRDGNTASKMGIPYYVNEFNKLAENVVKQFNAIHSSGYSMPVGGTSYTGVNFFYDNGTDPITAGNIKLDQKILDDVMYIAASNKKVDLSADNTQAGNNKNALALVDLMNGKNLPNIGSFSGYLKSTILSIATEAEHSYTMLSAQNTVSSNLESRKLSISAVSLDEEMTNMIRFSHAYNAASRAITAMDESLEVLISKMGLVGR